MSTTDPTTPATSATARPAGVIHDLGYQGYSGPREGLGRTSLALWLSGFGALFGFGRPARAKIRPIVLLAICLIPAIVMVGFIVLTRAKSLPSSYADFPSQLQLMISLFVATQAPLLMSADQRSGAVALYFARPTGPVTYALARLGSLLAATLVFVWTPMIVLYAGALLGELGVVEQTKQLLLTMGVSGLLALAVTGVAGAISAFSTRRGFAVLAIIGVLLLLDGAVAIVADLATSSGNPTAAEAVGLLSPYSAYRGAAAGLGALAPSSGNWLLHVANFATLIAFGAAGTAATVWRMRKVAGR